MSSTFTAYGAALTHCGDAYDTSRAVLARITIQLSLHGHTHTTPQHAGAPAAMHASMVHRAIPHQPAIASGECGHRSRRLRHVRGVESQLLSGDPAT